MYIYIYIYIPNTRSAAARRSTPPLCGAGSPGGDAFACCVLFVMLFYRSTVLLFYCSIVLLFCCSVGIYELLLLSVSPLSLVFLLDVDYCLLAAGFPLIRNSLIHIYIYIHVYVCMYVCMCVCIHIYIYRERERERLARAFSRHT